MKKDNQRILLFIIGGLLLLTSIIAFVMVTDSNKSTNEKEEEKEPVVTPTLNKEIVRISDTDIIFAIQDVITNFYIEMFNNKENAILLLDKNYVSRNRIDETNITNFINQTNADVKFIVDEGYYNKDSNMTYYFIKGYTIDNINEQDNLYYLLKVDMENNYAIMPLKDIENLEEYAKDYNLSRLYIDNETSFVTKEISDVNKLNNYIENFKNIMYIDSNRAYNMLNDTTKSKYIDLNTFINDRDNIASRLFDKFDNIDVNEENNMIIYNIKNNNNDSIIITEEYPNDYKIDFNFFEITE